MVEHIPVVDPVPTADLHGPMPIRVDPLPIAYSILT